MHHTYYIIYSSNFLKYIFPVSMLLLHVHNPLNFDMENERTVTCCQHRQYKKQIKLFQFLDDP